MRTFSSATEFASDRIAVLDRAEHFLLPSATRSLKNWGEADWFMPVLSRADLLFQREYRDEAGQSVTGDARKAWRSVEKDLTKTLRLTTKPTKFTPATLVRYIATATVNLATEAAAADDPAELMLEWVSMHDDRVRHSHRELNGQQRKMGEPFHVNGIEIRRPGDVSAPIDEWINCRCVLRADEPAQEALVAAAGTPTGKPSVIVALPHPDDPVNGMGPEPSHVTLVYLGDCGEVEDPNAINDEVSQVADQVKVPQVADAVSGTGTLGPDNANVLLMDGHHLGGLRNALLDHPAIKAAHGNAKQHPHWIPHLTVGYPGQPQQTGAATAAPEPGWKLTKPAAVSFDRLAVWHGDMKTEHPLGKKDDDMDPEDKNEAPETGAPDAEDKREGSEYALTASGAPAPIPWHGVLTTEGHQSGDRRSFKAGSLRTRNLPLPLTWQKVSDEGHKGSVKIARIDSITRVPIDGGKNEIRAHGLMMPADDNADKVIGEMAFYGRIGVSVDVDDATFEATDATDGGRPNVEFTDARVSSACAVIIPAFQEAWLQLGEPPEGFMDGGTSTAEAEATEVDTAVAAEMAERFAIDKPWDGSASRFTDEQYARSCVLDRGADAGPAKQRYSLPIREPGGGLNRRAVHAAASRLSSVSAPDDAKAAAKSKLRSAYRELGETPPFDALDVDPLAGSPELAEQFARGPGWVTNPDATQRIHDYWTVPGEPGYEKIAWGTEGDFDRCVTEIGQERSEKDPAGTARYIQAQCAQWQHDAIGVWPGRGEKLAADDTAVDSPTVTLVAASSRQWPVAKFARFGNPGLTEVTPLTYAEDDDGHTYVYGHLAEWGQCHLDFSGVCVTPPPLADAGDNFMVGRVETDNGLLRTGCLTLGGGHADVWLTHAAAKAHYDDVTTAVADVCVGEDEFGIWFAGMLRPWTTEQQRYQLLACDISGDWREYGGSMALIAAHAVNSGGFRTKARTRVIDGVQSALVAAGGVPHRPLEPVQVTELTIEATGGGGGGGFHTVRAEVPPDIIRNAVAEGIRTYRESSEAAAKIKEVAVASGATTAERLARVAEKIGD